MTEADLLKCPMRQVSHVNGGKVFFGYIYRCNQHPRLTRFDKYIRATRAVEIEWRIDGKPVASLAEAAIALLTPYQATPEDLALLVLVPDEFTRLEDRVRFVGLAEVGLIEFRDGACRRTDTGRSVCERS